MGILGKPIPYIAITEYSKPKTECIKNKTAKCSLNELFTHFRFLKYTAVHGLIYIPKKRKILNPGNCFCLIPRSAEVSQK